MSTDFGKYPQEIEHMRGLIAIGREQLLAGASALDVAVEAIAAMEDSGLYVAGRGSMPNCAGGFELDASLMDGFSARAGAVGALSGFRNPIKVARAVIEGTPHVMLVGDGAARFARTAGLCEVTAPEDWYLRQGSDDPDYLRLGAASPGTVGCVVLDRTGKLAAGTSTGGAYGKLPGRLGDSPIIGAGCWADRTAAVSCTGMGEHYIRSSAASQVAFRMRLGGQGLIDSAAETLNEIEHLGGCGGLIAVSAMGEITMPFNCAGLKSAALLANGKVVTQAFYLEHA